MTEFLIFAAALLLLAWLILLPALLRRPRAGAPLHTPDSARSANLAVLREQLRQQNSEFAAGGLSAEQHGRARAEIERRVLDEERNAEAPAQRRPARKTALLIGVLVPMFAFGLYVGLGNIAALDPQSSAAAGGAGDVTLAQVETMVEQLAQRLANDPATAKDPKGWTMLGRAYAAMQRYADARKAFSHAIELSPKDAQLLADQADVVAMLQGQRTDGEPARLIEQALQIDPDNAKALALAGSVAFERKDYAAAIAHWSRARRAAPPDSGFAKGLDAGIADAQAAQAGTPGASMATSAAIAVTAQAAAASNSAGSTTDAPAARVAGRVSIAPALATKVAANDTVFIFARAVDGPRMPLAILRRSASELPITFTLDDSQSMSPALKLSKFPMVIVGARISKSGSATPSPGDLTGTSAAVPVGGGDIELLIDSVQP